MKLIICIHSMKKILFGTVVCLVLVGAAIACNSLAGGKALARPEGTLLLSINGEEISVRVARVESGTKTSKIILSCKIFFKGFLEIRNLDTTVTVVKAEGLVLDDSSIVTAPDGMRGVFVKNKLGEHVFKPIKAKADNGTKCVVYSDIYVDDEGNFVETIRTYDEIVSEPTEEDMAGLEKSHPAKKQ